MDISYRCNGLNTRSIALWNHNFIPDANNEGKESGSITEAHGASGFILRKINTLEINVRIEAVATTTNALA